MKELALLLVLGTSLTVPQTIKTTFICPEGFKSIGKKCYHFSKQPALWTDSHFHCQILNSTLLVFNSLKEQNLLKGFITQDNYSTVDSGERWIDGLYDWKQHKWKWGSSGKPIQENSFTRKHTGEAFRWNCIAINQANNNRWVARKCSDQKPFICETSTNAYVEFKLYSRKKRKFNLTKCSSGLPLLDYEKRKCLKLLGRTEVQENEPAPLTVPEDNPGKSHHANWICPAHMINLDNRCYTFSDHSSTWQDAHFECRRNDSRLASIKSKKQDYNLRMFLNNFIEKQDRWIGGMYDWKSGKWRWAMTGQPLSYRGFSKAAMKSRSSQDLAWNSIFMDPALDNHNVDFF
ncbi:unnamed protein product [Phyllotreta striolata]|uniref:C-type lectin domain-containing protein n=1 Tax=Phyllotreta striolata TaxID=444603 RepID=A0A9P0GWU8_PHYSR|nr:unnamed protein product [Phyllotreta striolata]